MPDLTMEKLTVGLGSRSYDILLGFGLLDRLPELIAERKLGNDAFIITDSTVARLYGKTVEKRLWAGGFGTVKICAFPDGDENKNWESYRLVMDELASFEPSPGHKMIIICLGGGVPGDLGGFVAATFKRGVPFVQVPTTLLACVDSGVGGKVGINWRAKNQVGAFWQPSLVVADPKALGTLDERQIRSGMAEIIKYGAALDAFFFAYLEDNAEKVMARESRPLIHACKRSYEIKAAVVSADERDTLDRRISLNFGHTLGHAAEFLPGSDLSHGEAVSFGMACALDISVEMGLLAKEDGKRVKQLLRRAGLPTRLPGLDVDAALEMMRRDKKFKDGRARFVLLKGIGEFIVAEEVEDALIRKILAARTLIKG
ncbi:MAG TPA: 3-dehydroquinate synthase [Candidatus Brocadiia bacterium]|nr:3-dehydroquinate synthase [Candidatus Brocadiia bacterium]